MSICPDICVVAQGHTDNSNSSEYNKVLSFNRASAAVDYLVETYDISRDRLKIMYGGEESPLINNATRESQQYMNRRVEFKVCGVADFEMERPAGPNAGQGAKKPSSTYRGNKNSGY